MAIRLKLEKTDRVLFCGSKWWGDPDMPEGMTYPTVQVTEDGETYDYPLTFICQINCEDIAPFDKEGKFPHEGMLYFFAALDKWNLSAYLGYTALQDKDHCVPLSLRATRYFRENEKDDRWLTYLDLGSGISIKKHPQEIFTGKLGTGYRFSLSERTKIDVLASLRMTYGHSNIEFENTQISFDRINRNNIYGCALSVGLSLTF